MRHLMTAATIAALITMSAPLVNADPKPTDKPAPAATQPVKKFKVMAKLQKAEPAAPMNEQDLEQTKGSGLGVFVLAVGAVAVGGTLVCAATSQSCADGVVDLYCKAGGWGC